MSEPYVNIAYRILLEKGEPMHYRDITAEVQKIRTMGGKTPDATLRTDMGRDPRFVRIGQGVYALVELNSINSRPELNKENELSIKYENDLEEHLVRDLSQLENGLTIFEKEGLNGRQYNTDVGRIDILAVDKNNNFVVIELKAHLANDSAVGQVLGYMSYVSQKLAKGNTVRGFIVAREFDKRVKYAVEYVPKLSLRQYFAKFKFEEISNQ
jgi:hypothetical protein